MIFFSGLFYNPVEQIRVILSQLHPGQSGIIEQVQGDDALASRLMEMGIIDGEPIEVIGRAPMGDPTEYSLRGYRLSLRKSESDRVEVTLLP